MFFQNYQHKIYVYCLAQASSSLSTASFLSLVPFLKDLRHELILSMPSSRNSAGFTEQREESVVSISKRRGNVQVILVLIPRAVCAFPVGMEICITLQNRKEILLPIIVYSKLSP